MDNQKEEMCPKFCAGCGLPPTLDSTTQLPVPLRSCSRCHQAWYHNVKCQKSHYKKHRKVCLQHSKAQGSTQSLPTKRSGNHSTVDGAKGQRLRVTVKPRRGRCLVAMTAIRNGDTVGIFEPKIPPVLMDSHRQVRCSVCFGLIHEWQGRRKDNGGYVSLYCSEECEAIGRREGLSAETILVNQLIQHTPRIKILPTALLVFRILRKILWEEMEKKDNQTKVASSQSTSFRCNIETLMHHSDYDDILSNPTTDKAIHFQAVRITVSKLLMLQELQNDGIHRRESAVIVEQLCEETFLKQLASKLQTNAFSIQSHDADNDDVLGIGLFDNLASSINHSCAPTALQSFSYGKRGLLPKLRVEACADIFPDDEVTIAYIDRSQSRDVRQAQLAKNYKFKCQCERCTEEEAL